MPPGPIDSPPDGGEDNHRENTLALHAYLRSRPTTLKGLRSQGTFLSLGGFVSRSPDESKIVADEDRRKAIAHVKSEIENAPK